MKYVNYTITNFIFNSICHEMSLLNDNLGKIFRLIPLYNMY